MSITQVSVALIAIAFTVLVVFLIRTLKAAENSLNKTAQTLEEVQKTIEELSYEVKQVVRQANGITEDVQNKMKSIDPVLATVKNVGDVLNEVSLAAKQVSTSLIDRFKKVPARKERVQSVRADGVYTESERLQHAQELSNKTKERPHTNAKWVKWVDIAADLWKKYRA